MENKQIPGQEPLDRNTVLLPEEPEADFPPVMAELTFDPDPVPISLEDIPQVEEAVAEESVPLPEIPNFMERIPEVAEPVVPETVPSEPASADQAAEEFSSFMDRIPEVAEPVVPEAVSAEPDQPAEKPSDELEDLLDMQFLKEPEADPAEPEEDLHDQAYRDNGKEFETLFQAQARQSSKKPDVQRPAQKGRPKRKKGEGLFGIPNILVTVVWLALILVIGMTLGRMLWVCAADVLAFGREDKAVTVTIYEADTMDDIVDKLHDAGLIRYKSLFNLYAGISDAEEDIKPGIYDLNTRYDYHALVNFMSPSSTRQVIKLTIPEGYTCRQIFALLEENRICTAVDLGVYAASGQLSDYWFLEGVERGTENALEGYLFPDTYEFYKNSTPREALEKMLDNFNHRFTDEMRAQIETLNANITGGGYGVREITIIASLIEKESAAPAESANISGVIYNRLFNWEYPALLNIDAAIVYAQGGEADTIDTNLDSPYNTYTHVGLTPTPIANPGLASLQAALNPATHDYYYYVLNPESGMHAFSTTQDEHNANIAAFYN